MGVGGDSMRALRLAHAATLLAAFAGTTAAAQPAPHGAPAAKAPATAAPTAQPTPADAAVNADKMIEPGSQMMRVKPGSIEDVSAVGHRRIGGRGWKNWYSEASEVKLGKLYAAEIDKSTQFITDPVVTEYVNRIGQNLVRNSDCKEPFTIKIIDSDEINAFALPGGYFYVNSGLILNAGDEDELAGVMAHEIAHVCAHHAARQMTRLNYAQFGAIPLIMVGGWAGYGVYEAAGVGVPVYFLKFDREFEAQADYLGVQYMYRAGYDPEGLIRFFQKIEALEKHKPGLVAKAFSDHPQTPDRILRTQQEIAQILPAREQYLVTTSEFDDVKARLGRIEDHRRLHDAHQGKKPAQHGAGPEVSGLPPALPHTIGQPGLPSVNPQNQPSPR